MVRGVWCVSVGETAALDDPDVDPCELFVAIGMLVLESRLPTASVKGRRDGLHCPQAVGHWSSHECDLTQSQVTTDQHSAIYLSISCESTQQHFDPVLVYT